MKWENEITDTSLFYASLGPFEFLNMVCLCYTHLNILIAEWLY